MANQDVTNLKRDSLHGNLTGLDRPKRVHLPHAMGAWRNFDRAVLRSNPHQTKTDDQEVHRERKVRDLRKERIPVIHMRVLIFRSMQRHIAAPLVGYHPVPHQLSHNAQYVIVKEESWEKNWRIERHWEEMTMCAPVRRMAAVEICEQTRPERLSTSLNQDWRKVVSQDAKA
jgi:hypothetical protein